MPVYQLAHAGVPLTIIQRDRLARGITAIHHEVTNAPEPFVRVVFEPLPFGNIYTAGEIGPAVVLVGNIRAGRPEAAKQQIVERCHALVREVTDVPPDQIVIGVNEMPSAWMMEAGFFMPDPTDEAEAAWIAHLQETFPGKYDQWGTGGQHVDLQTADEPTRVAQLRQLTERYLTVARGQGHDVKALIGQLTHLLDRDETSSDGR